jgi:hypothetical protein
VYTALVTVHSWVRWAVILAGLVAFIQAVRGRVGDRPWNASDEACGRWFLQLLEVQVVLGVAIYLAVSPFTLDGLRDLAGTMGNAPLRFIVVEHPFGMLAAITLASVGRGRVRKANTPERKHGLAAIFIGLALAIILVSVPWPFMPGGRALFRGL